MAVLITDEMIIAKKISELQNTIQKSFKCKMDCKNCILSDDISKRSENSHTNISHCIIAKITSWKEHNDRAIREIPKIQKSIRKKFMYNTGALPEPEKSRFDLIGELIQLSEQKPKPDEKPIEQHGELLKYLYGDVAV